MEALLHTRKQNCSEGGYLTPRKRRRRDNRKHCAGFFLPFGAIRLSPIVPSACFHLLASNIGPTLNFPRGPETSIRCREVNDAFEILAKNSNGDRLVRSIV